MSRRNEPRESPSQITEVISRAVSDHPGWGLGMCLTLSVACACHLLRFAIKFKNSILQLEGDFAVLFFPSMISLEKGKELKPRRIWGLSRGHIPRKATGKPGVIGSGLMSSLPNRLWITLESLWIFLRGNFPSCRNLVSPTSQKDYERDNRCESPRNVIQFTNSLERAFTQFTSDLGPRSFVVIIIYIISVLLISPDSS